MAQGKLFGGGQVGAVTLVETPVSQWYIRRARIALLTVSVVSGLLTAVVLSAFLALPWSVALGVVAGGVLGFVAAVLVRVWPVVRVLWWWSLEIAAVGSVTVGMSALSRSTTWWVALATLLLLVAAGAAVRPVRVRLVAWSWCLMVRHRLRLCFSTLIRNSSGSRPAMLPMILWAKPTPAGERVWLWLRPGLELEDLDGKTGKVAVTCWASEVRVVRASQRFAALVRIDVARRDPLSGVVPSPLALLIPKHDPADVPVSPAVSLFGLNLADIAEPAPEPPARGGRR